MTVLAIKFFVATVILGAVLAIMGRHWWLILWTVFFTSLVLVTVVPK